MAMPPRQLALVLLLAATVSAATRRYSRSNRLRCQHGLRNLMEEDSLGRHQLLLLPDGADCDSGELQLNILVDENRKPIGRADLNSIKVQKGHDLYEGTFVKLRGGQNVSVNFAGWYFVNWKNDWSDRSQLRWVEGIKDPRSWTFSILSHDDAFQRKEGNSPAQCYGYLLSVTDQTHPSFSELLVKLYKLNELDRFDYVREMRLTYPEQESLQAHICNTENGKEVDMVAGETYKIVVEPVTSLCGNSDGNAGCPNRVWQITVPEFVPPLPARVQPAYRPWWIAFLCLGVAIFAAAVAAVIWFRRNLRSGYPLRGVACRASAPGAGGTVLLLAPSSVRGSAARQLDRLRSLLTSHGLRVFSLQDRVTLQHLQRHPSPADALGMPPLHRARLLFVAGPDDADTDVTGGAGMQGKLFSSLLHHVRCGRLALDYRRVFVVSLGGAAPRPPLAHITDGRVFRAEDDAELLVRHLGAATEGESEEIKLLDV